jgi:uncharacterized protein YoxC
MEDIQSVLKRVGVCTTCNQLIQHEIAAPFASCGCGTAEWHKLDSDFMQYQKRVYENTVDLLEKQNRILKYMQSLSAKVKFSLTVHLPVVESGIAVQWIDRVIKEVSYSVTAKTRSFDAHEFPVVALHVDLKLCTKFDARIEVLVNLHELNDVTKLNPFKMLERKCSKKTDRLSVIYTDRASKVITGIWTSIPAHDENVVKT